MPKIDEHNEKVSEYLIYYLNEFKNKNMSLEFLESNLNKLLVKDKIMKFKLGIKEIIFNETNTLLNIMDFKYHNSNKIIKNFDDFERWIKAKIKNRNKAIRYGGSWFESDIEENVEAFIKTEFDKRFIKYAEIFGCEKIKSGKDIYQKDSFGYINMKDTETLIAFYYFDKIMYEIFEKIIEKHKFINVNHVYELFDYYDTKFILKEIKTILKEELI